MVKAVLLNVIRNILIIAQGSEVNANSKLGTSDMLAGDISGAASGF